MVYEVIVDEKYDIKFNGIIDRTIKGKEGGYLIIDYKTSKRESTKFDLYSDHQLQGYAYAIHKKFKVPIEKIVAAHYYPVSNNFVTVKYSVPQIAQYVRSKKEEIWRIRKMKSCEFQPSENRFCNWCGYKGICSLFTEPHVITENMKNTKTKKRRK
jgi:putative RecB family exonuclease